jgi:D-glycero-D-manno-heptose 1,7-bisphosphate phosphatase
MPSTRAAILDRDGTLIEILRDAETGLVYTAFHPDHVRLLPGTIEGLRTLQERGFVLGIATNQPGVAKGHFALAAIERTNAVLVEMLAAKGIRIAAVETCPHSPQVAPCDCRKPKPGLLTRLLARFDADPSTSWMLGDAASDAEAGRAAGMRTGLLYAPGRCELCPIRDADARGNPEVAAPTLPELVAKLLTAA